MQSGILLAIGVGLILVLLQFGIELALVLATVVSGAVWLGYRLAAPRRAPVPAEGAAEVTGTAAPEPLLYDYAKSFFPIFLIVLLLRSFLVEPFRIPSGSMMPTLLVGDFILVNKFAYGIRLPVTKQKLLELGRPERGDVAVFRWPTDNKTDYIKRIVGLPGDRISYRNKTLFVNGEPARISGLAPYTPVGSGARAKGSLEGVEQLGDTGHAVLINPFVPDFGSQCRFLRHREVTVPAGHYFAMGDNRDDSNDSRCWGFVPDANLVGEAFVVWLSWDWRRPGWVAWRRLGNLID